MRLRSGTETSFHVTYIIMTKRPFHVFCHHFNLLLRGHSALWRSIKNLRYSSNIETFTIDVRKCSGCVYFCNKVYYLLYEYRLQQQTCNLIICSSYCCIYIITMLLYTKTYFLGYFHLFKQIVNASNVRT